MVWPGSRGAEPVAPAASPAITANSDDAADDDAPARRDGAAHRPPGAHRFAVEHGADRVAARAV